MFYFILDQDRKVIPMPFDTKTKEGFYQWGQWWDNDDNRRVGVDFVGDLRISTFFIGVGRTVFETIVFEVDGSDRYIKKTNTWEEAEVMHRETVAAIKAQLEKNI